MGTQAVAVPNFQNGPSPTAGSRVEANYQAFMQNTQENIKRLGAFVPQVTNPFAEQVNFYLPKTGIMKKTHLWCTVTFTVANGSGATTVRDWMPHNIVKRVQLKGNGADVHSISGVGLHVRSMRRRNNPPTTNGGITGIDSVPASLAAGATPANGTYTVKFLLELPLCYSYENGIGAIFAESAGAQYEVVMSLASKADMFSFTSNADVTGFTFNVQPVHHWWTIPRKNINGVEVTYVPDLSRMFELQEKVLPVTATGDFPAELAQANGNAMCVMAAVRNNNAQLDPAAGGLDYIGWNYASNETPRLYNPTESLLWENANAYNGRLPYKYFALDFERENPLRDAIRPRGVTGLNVDLGIPSSLSLSGATVTLVQELLIGAGNGPAVEVVSAS